MSEPKRLVIIDDDPDSVSGIKDIHEIAQYAVDADHDPDEELAAHQKETYDLLLLDIMMGRGAEGIRIARTMGQDEKLKKMPTLIITGIQEQMAILFPGQPIHYLKE